MTSFPMIEADGNAILDYIKNENAKDERLSSNVDSSFLDCGVDTFYVSNPKFSESFFEPGQEYDADPIGGDTLQLPDTADRQVSFRDPNPTAGRYDFMISTFGWYNIDAFAQGYSGTSLVNIELRVEPEVIRQEVELHVYLFCPDKKILSVAYKQNDRDNYFLDKINDKVPLFLGDRAIAFAFGSVGERMYFGFSEFRIKADQTINISVTETSTAELQGHFLMKKINGVDLEIDEKERVIQPHICNADSITAK